MPAPPLTDPLNQFPFPRADPPAQTIHAQRRAHHTEPEKRKSVLICACENTAYQIPYVGFWKLFEMPALGYLGYPFFGLIVFTWTSIVVAGLFNRDLVGMFERPERQRNSATALRHM